MLVLLVVTEDAVVGDPCVVDNQVKVDAQDNLLEVDVQVTPVEVDAQDNLVEVDVQVFRADPEIRGKERAQVRSMSYYVRGLCSRVCFHVVVVGDQLVRLVRDLFRKESRTRGCNSLSGNRCSPTGRSLPPRSSGCLSCWSGRAPYAPQGCWLLTALLPCETNNPKD